MAYYNLQQIREIISREIENASIFIADADYASPNKSWVIGKFYNSYRNWLQKHQLNKWESYYDCNRFAYTFSVFASFCHAKTMQVYEKMGRQTFQGISIGVIYYNIGGKRGNGHAINFFVTEGKVHYIEPQNGKIINLTKEEKDSAWFVTI